MKSNVCKFTIFLIACCVVVLPAVAADSKVVSYKSGDETISGVMYWPARADKAAKPLPAIVVIHEWWGLNGWIKEQAEKFADLGYVTLAVDLYRGKVATTPDEAHELMRGLPEDRSVRDMKAAVAFLKTQKNVDAKRIGAIGWCMGGSRTAVLAVNEPTLAAAVINYGGLPSDLETVKNINAAVLGLFGGQDRGIPVESVKTFESQLKSLGKKVEVKVYPEAGHAFENPNNKSGYRADDAADAWSRQVKFFESTLKK